ncbi:MAG TPA: NUDIX domain-containing protein [Dehalococcoidia bacterium]|nr:NUDIX domain-containing protein [Dehalococcoidia bacterium]
MSRTHMSAGVLLLDPQGRVLLQLRDDRPDIMFPNHWGLIGGAAEPGETPVETALREVREETGLTLAPEALRPFRVYTWPADDSGRDYALHMFVAVIDPRPDELRPSEGQEVRFFDPSEVEALPLAYNHRDILRDLLASEEWRRYRERVNGYERNGTGALEDPIAHFVNALDAGVPWFEALLQAIGLWTLPREEANGRTYEYLIQGEAFDWLLLAERLCEEVADRLPPDEHEALVFFGRAPVPDFSDADLRAALGQEKHSAHLNFLYGVIVEEALQLCVEEEIQKACQAHVYYEVEEEPNVFQRIYGKTREELLAAFRDAHGLPHGDSISYGELQRFTYWLFKYRVANCEPARVASDTRKALAQLSRMETLVRQRRAARFERARDELVLDLSSR